jgi:hypothetical protein
MSGILKQRTQENKMFQQQITEMQQYYDKSFTEQDARCTDKKAALTAMDKNPATLDQALQFLTLIQFSKCLLPSSLFPLNLPLSFSVFAQI